MRLECWAGRCSQPPAGHLSGVADLRKRARAKTEAEETTRWSCLHEAHPLPQAEGVLWLAHGFGTLELVKEDLCIGQASWTVASGSPFLLAGVEIPPFAWAGLEKVGLSVLLLRTAASMTLVLHLSGQSFSDGRRCRLSLRT